jgi:D-3-phosphoglycerate dehydrogenase
MKDGVRILNLARGELVDDEALLPALESGKVARYVTDFPNARILSGRNVVPFPHLAASTPEAEEKCAVMGAQEIVDYLHDGNIRNSVNLPNASLERLGESRLCIFHKNQPKMLNQFLEIIAEHNINVEHMMNKARGEYAYTIFDTGTKLGEETVRRISAVEGVGRVRLI